MLPDTIRGCTPPGDQTGPQPNRAARHRVLLAAASRTVVRSPVWLALRLLIAHGAAGSRRRPPDVGTKCRATGFVAVMAATRISSPVNRHRPALRVAIGLV